MNDEQLGTIVKYVAGVWPHTSMTDETFAVYRMELGGFDPDVVVRVVREVFGADPFPPTVLQLANAAREWLHPTISYEQGMAELLDKIATVGYAQPEPQWSHPAIGEVVRLRGGWVEVCAGTPARAAVDAAGLSTFNTWAAQFRDQFRLVAVRGEREHHPALGGGSAVALPDLRQEDR